MAGPEESIEGRRPARGRRAGDTVLSMLKGFWRLWGFLGSLVLLILVFRQVVTPFVFAVLIAYLLAPLVKRLAPRLGRGGAVIGLYAVIAAFLALFLGVLLPAVVKDLSRLRDTAPELIARANEDWLPRAGAWVDDQFGDLLEAHEEQGDPSTIRLVPQEDGSFLVDLRSARLEVHESSGGWVVEAAGNEGPSLGDSLRAMVASKGAQITAILGELLRSAVAATAGFVTDFIVTFMIAGFVLVDLNRVKAFIRSLIPKEFWPEFDELVAGMDMGMAGVLRGQLLICLVNGTLTYIGLLLFSVKYALLLGLLAGVFSLIPIFGTILSSIPIILIALLSDESGGLNLFKPMAMAVWIGFIHLIEGNYLNPKIIGGAAHIHPVIVVFALLAGESVYGLTGALFAVPVASMIQTVFVFARRRARGFAAVEEREVSAGSGDEVAAGSEESSKAPDGLEVE